MIVKKSTQMRKTMKSIWEEDLTKLSLRKPVQDKSQRKMKMMKMMMMIKLSQEPIILLNMQTFKCRKK